MCHVYVRSDSLAAVLISDHEYPQRVAFTLINKVRIDVHLQTRCINIFGTVLGLLTIKIWQNLVYFQKNSDC